MTESRETKHADLKPDHRKYGNFISRVVSTEKLWGIWCGDTWATSNNPSKTSQALFLLWPSKASATECLRENREKFPAGAAVESIELGKWIELYTPDLVSASAAVLVAPDQSLRGLIVDPKDLSLDIGRSRYKGELQSSDLGRLARDARKKKQDQ